jgi:(4S)-4-hydroxy-5-phosphonooxypentane-2,3-dione isomerase
MAMSLIILVEFVIKREMMGEFRQLITDNARSSLESEPGCRRFDVLSVQDEPSRIILYEIYADEAAFDRHLQTHHYKIFAEASKSMIESVSVRRLTFLERPKS